MVDRVDEFECCVLLTGIRRGATNVVGVPREYFPRDFVSTCLSSTRLLSQVLRAAYRRWTAACKATAPKADTQTCCRGRPPPTGAMGWTRAAAGRFITCSSRKTKVWHPGNGLLVYWFVSFLGWFARKGWCNGVRFVRNSAFKRWATGWWFWLGMWYAVDWLERIVLWMAGCSFADCFPTTVVLAQYQWIQTQFPIWKCPAKLIAGAIVLWLDKNYRVGPKIVELLQNQLFLQTPLWRCVRGCAVGEFVTLFCYQKLF